jgi:hypothetical protein
MNKKTFDKLSPDSVAVAMWIGSDDVVTLTGREMLDDAKNEIQNPTLSEAVLWTVKNTTGNSFNILVCKDNKIKVVELD